MSVKIMEKEKKSSSKKVPQAYGDLIMAVERIAEIDAMIANFGLNKLTEERGKLEEKLRASIVNAPADQSVTIEGMEHDVVFSEKFVQRKITDMAKVRKALGAETFMEVAKVTLGDLDKYLSEKEREPLLEVTRSGARRMKVVEKG